ncbi:MAG: methionyl-tRNA formyltransferase [Bacilli bacterium]|nr:methionyl-tRNA formyltransferase [Bacilli bacterium]MBN2876604.1 methionyl-tRNA formyltransferase [Bacilli bacterium]
MKICFMGSMNFAVPILEGLAKQHQVLLVVTQPDKPVGRKRVITPTPVKTKAIELGIPVFQPISIKQDYDSILSLDFDLIIVAAYGQMIPEKVLFSAKRPAINVHASLLPKYRGGSPMHRSIQYGDDVTGVSIMYMAMKMDSGDVLDQASIPIEETDNVGTIERKLSIIGRDLLLDVINRLDHIQPKPQDESKITFAYNIKPEEEKIHFDQSAKQIFDHVRGFYPWPLTYFIIDNHKIKLYRVTYRTESLSDTIGEIVISNKREVGIQTKNGIVMLEDLQLQGKQRMAIKDFMNGSGRDLLALGKIAE